jgi:hypothetical protein
MRRVSTIKPPIMAQIPRIRGRKMIGERTVCEGLVAAGS